LSRNDFAGFLELSFPVALWLGLSARSAAWLWAPAWMLAAGVASASRAGVVCLALETLVILAITRRAKAARFLAAAAVLIAIAGAGTLLGRLADSDPLLYRREIAGSALEMIRAHPWRGFGIGTFPQVYPAFATFDAGALVEHAHNEWLEWAAGGGLPYAAVWAAFAAALFVPALRSVWGVGIIAAFVHATVDYPFARFGLTAWTFSLAGALCGDRNRALRELGQRGH
jgi:O-antigen ligase